MTRNQILGALVVVVSVLMISTAQLTDLFGPTVAKSIVSAAAILNGILGGWVTLMSTQGNQAKDAAQIKGVKLKVTADADPAIAKLAVDPNQPDIGALNPEDRPALQAKANG